MLPLYEMSDRRNESTHRCCYVPCFIDRHEAEAYDTRLLRLLAVVSCFSFFIPTRCDMSVVFFKVRKVLSQN